MAAIFLRSTDGNDGNAGTQKEAAKATFAAALTAAGAGGSVYMSSIHAETQASAMTLTSPGTAASPTLALCVADWGAATGTGIPTTLATTGTVSTTGANAINCNGYLNGYGFTLSAGNSTSTGSINFSSAANSLWTLDTCGLTLLGTSSSARLSVNSSGLSDCGLTLRNPTITFSNTGQGISCAGPCRLIWNGGSVANATIPTTLFISATGLIATITGVDLSVFGSGKNLITVASAAVYQTRFNSCKLGASVSITTGSVVAPQAAIIDVINCDSADTNYRRYNQTYAGTITHETTIKRTGGASDGVTGNSLKFVSTANTNFCQPILGPWIKFWNSTIGSVTVPIEIVTDNVTLTDAEAWVEVLYPGTSSFPLGVFANDRAADILATPANQTTSSETWTTTGLTTPVTQVFSKAVTPTKEGWIYARGVLAKASTTVYMCPKILSTSTYQYMEEDGSIVNGPNIPSGGSSPSIGISGPLLRGITG